MPPAAQILNWLFRPIEFLDSCREQYGDSFQISFPGFETPMVIVSRPEHVAAVFKPRDNGLPPGRTVALEPILGSQSILLLEGEEHLARRKLMLPPFHGERKRAYEEPITAIVEPEPGAEIDSAELIEHVKSRLARYKAPKSVIAIKSVGRAVNGKLDYKALTAVATERLAET